MVNISTPNYRQVDLSQPKFQEMLRERVDERKQSGLGMVSFDDIQAEVEHPERGMLFHDGQSRSMEQLMSDQAKNGMIGPMDRWTVVLAAVRECNALKGNCPWTEIIAESPCRSNILRA